MFNKYTTVIFFIIYLNIFNKNERHEYINKIKEKRYFDFSKRIEKTFNKIDLAYIHKLKKLVYTANLGNYDLVKKVKKQKGYDYFLFIDEYDEMYNNSNWTIILIPEEIKKLNMTLIIKQRYIKTHPHIFFPNYDLSIYMDSTYGINNNNLDEFLLRILTPNISVYMLEHPERNKIMYEFILVRLLKKENNYTIATIKKKYNREKFPDDTGLIEGCLIVRKHNDKNCINLMENWFNEIKNYSHRDQLSFNYVLWKTNIKIKYLSKKYCFNYLSGDYFHRKNYTFKY